MINLDKVSKSIIKDVANNMGWESNEPIKPYLEKISQMSPEQIMGKWAAWHLGSSEWADMIIDGYKQLKAAEKK